MGWGEAKGEIHTVCINVIHVSPIHDDYYDKIIAHVHVHNIANSLCVYKFMLWLDEKYANVF